MSEADQGAIDRAAIAKEIWADAEQSPDAELSQAVMQSEGDKTVDAEIAAAAVEKPDPWAGIPSALREEVEALQAKVSNFDQMDARLKQAERRVGAMTTELHAAKDAAKAVANAPTKEQIVDASASEAEWAELKEAFPEWTSATEKRIASANAETLKRIPDAEVIKRQVAEQVETIAATMAGNLISLRHPDWKTIRDSKEFMDWQGDRNSDDPIEVIGIFDEYKAYKASLKTPKQIEAERDERLAASVTPRGRNLRPPKAESDMTEAEIRARVAAEVWR